MDRDARRRESIEVDPTATILPSSTRRNSNRPCGILIDVTVTWALDETHGYQQCFVPKGSLQVTVLANGGCTWDPLDAEIVESDGLLVVDTSTEPATYSGAGSTVWAMAIACPKAPVVNTPAPGSATRKTC